MKQMSLIEMDGFLKGKCIPRDLKVNETNAEYLVRKFGELESKLETALRECRSAGITIDNLEAKCAELTAENAGLKEALEWLYEAVSMPDSGPIPDKYYSAVTNAASVMYETPATDTFLAEVRAQGVEMFAASLNVVGGGEHPYSAVANEFAAQIRKGGNQ